MHEGIFLLEDLVRIARRAGRAIMDVYKGDKAAWQKEDASPLTIADLRADEIIRCELEKLCPGIFILSEESVSENGGSGEAFFLVDPLDGTKEFLKRNGEFTVNIALVVEGVLEVSVVDAPALEETFFAAKGRGACRLSGDKSTRLSCVPPLGVLRVIGSRSHGDERLQRWLSSLAIPFQIDSAGSSLKFCRIAEGRADVYLRFGPTSQWDTAAAQLVLEEAGGRVVDFAGKHLGYGSDRPILNPAFIASGFELGSRFLGLEYLEGC